MKVARWLRLTTLTALGIGMTALSKPAIAVNFANTEVDQSRFVVLATAGGSRLTILEQVSNARPCWRENGNAVDPLLLSFDFTGICGRSTDRNGYSVRVAGQDLGLQYSLRVVPQGNSMVLYATPSRSGVSLEIGRTRALPNSGFSRIVLNSGWRLTRRVYNGQPLGHLYLTNDQSLTTLIAANSTSQPVATRPTTPTPAPVTPPVTSNPPVTSPPVANNPSNPRVPSANNPIIIPVPSPQNPAPATPPQTGTRPTPQPPLIGGAQLPPPPPVLGGTGTNVAVLPVPTLPPTPRGDTAPGDPMVPVSRNPQAPGSYTGTPASPTQLASSLGFSYRVIVQANTPELQSRVRAIAPDAFRTVINGQVVMQAGLFRDRYSADAMQQQLVSQNLPASVVPVNN